MDNHTILGSKRRFLKIWSLIFIKLFREYKVIITWKYEWPWLMNWPWLKLTLTYTSPDPRGKLSCLSCDHFEVSVFSWQWNEIHLQWIYHEMKLPKKARFHTVCESHTNCLYHKQSHWQKQIGQDSTTEEGKSMDDMKEWLSSKGGSWEN